MTSGLTKGLARSRRKNQGTEEPPEPVEVGLAAD
jgi:hypothetical protein